MRDAMEASFWFYFRGATAHSSGGMISEAIYFWKFVKQSYSSLFSARKTVSWSGECEKASKCLLLWLIIIFLQIVSK